MTKRLFIDFDFEQVEHRMLASARVFRPLPDLVLVCTDTLGDDVLHHRDGGVQERQLNRD